MQDHSYNPMYGGAAPAKRGLRFSRMEIQHLIGAVLALSLAFAFVLGRPVGLGFGEFWFPPFLNFVAAFVAVASGFVLHEMGHKVVAQGYGHWAEFRAQFSGLGLSLFVAAFIGFLFAAPGAVMIMGRVTLKENGYISLVGPAINYAITLVSWPIALVLGTGNVGGFILNTVANVNIILCIFNLLPFGPLDGRKVMAWNKPVWILAIVLAIGTALVLFIPELLF